VPECACGARLGARHERYRRSIDALGRGAIASNNGIVLSGFQTRDFWRTTLGAQKLTTTLFPDLDPADGGQVQLEQYRGGKAGSEVAFYTVDGAAT